MKPSLLRMQLQHHGGHYRPAMHLSHAASTRIICGIHSHSMRPIELLHYHGGKHIVLCSCPSQRWLSVDPDRRPVRCGAEWG